MNPHNEIITEARLDRFAWPENDPRQLSQPQRSCRSTDDELIQNAATSIALTDESLLDSTHGKPAPDRVLRVLNDFTFRFNWRDKSKIGRKEVEDACAVERAIEIVVPYFCVVPNPVKRLEPVGPTVAEDVSLLHLGNMCRMVRLVYPPGLTIHVVSDSILYGPPYGISAVEALYYFDALKERVESLGLGQFILVHDFAQLLAGDLAMPFVHAYNQSYLKYKNGPLSDGTPQKIYDDWLASTLSNINTRKYALDYAALKSVFGPKANKDTDLWKQVHAEAEEALAEYRAVRAAAAELEWEKKLFPNALRASIHTKDASVLSLRVYPEYKITSKLLPYHGIAMIWFDETRQRWRLNVQPELFLAGRSDLTRVTDVHGRSSFYLRHTIEDGATSASC